LTFKESKSLNVFVPVSIGELIDKITILEIKCTFMNGEKLFNVKKELMNLKNILQKENISFDDELFVKLAAVNKKLWNIESMIRNKELTEDFGEEFIKLSRSIYKENDIRASLKKEINIKYKSNLIEEKSYIN
jgi:hypothetical protein